MANRLQKQSVLTYIVGVQGVAGRPAYCETVEVVTGYKEAPVGSFTFISLPSSTNTGFTVPVGAIPVYSSDGTSYGKTLIGYRVPSGSGAANGGYGSPLVPVLTTKEVCYPEVKGKKGVESKVNKSDVSGWNGSARSIRRLEDGEFFKVDIPPHPVGVMVGVSDGAYEYDYSYLDHALVVRPEGVVAVRKGSDVGSTYPAGDQITILKKSDSIVFLVNNKSIYRSKYSTSEPVYISVLLYSASDYVDNPLIGVFSEASGLSSLTMATYLDYTNGGVSELQIQTDAIVSYNNSGGGGGTTGNVFYVTGKSTFYAETNAACFAHQYLDANSFLTILSNADKYIYVDNNGVANVGLNYAVGKLANVGFIAEKNTFKGQGKFSKPMLEARANRIESEAVEASGLFPQPLSSGHILNGALLNGDGTQYAKGQSSEAVYFGGKSNSATHRKLTAWWSYLADDQLDSSEMLLSLDGFTLQHGTLFILSEKIEVGSFLDFYLVINLEAYEAVAIGSSVTLESIIEMIMQERLTVSGSTRVARKEALQFAVNSVTGALTTYKNFGFKQFATVLGETFAITDTGLYRLGGKTDNGDLLNASIDFGASDFGTAQLKRMSSVYAGLTTDGQVYIRTTGDNGQEVIYRAVSSNNESRAATAKGLSARHWRVRLELQEASHADLDNMEFEVGVSQRRLRGRS